MSNQNQLFNTSDGDVYVAFHRGEGEADNGTLNICFTTPSLPVSTVPKYQTIRVFPIFSASGAAFAGCDLQVMEAPTSFTSGSAAVWRNLNRNGDKVSAMQSIANVVNGFTKDGTCTGGTIIHQDASGHGNVGGMGLIALRTPLILKHGTDYGFIITSDTADTTSMLTLIAQQKEN